MINIFLRLLFLIVVAIAIAFIVPKIRSKIPKISWRGSLILSGLYLGVLIMVVPILYLLQEEGFSKLVDNRNQTETFSENAISDLYNHHLPPNGNLDNQPGLYKNSSQTFKVDTKKLAFNVLSNPGNTPIFVARKNVDDGKIEVSTYVANRFVGEIDFTKLALPPIITFQNGTLSLKSVHQSLDFVQFNADFTVNQFKNRNMGYENGWSSYFGQDVVYIRVPKSLEIDNNEKNGMNNVQMISSD